MVIDEIFISPSVKQVIFQIKYPNLFFIENKIGDIQTRIMDEFPESSLFTKRQIMFADIGPQGLEQIPQLEQQGKKVWNFKSPKNYAMSISSDSLDITSEYHKTYNMGDGDKFRDIIQYVVNNFLAVINIPTINRIGLRYIDEFPVFKKTNNNFKRYYNTKLPINTFKIEDTEDMEFYAITKKGPYYLRYGEVFKKLGESYKLAMDFDGFANNIASQNYLEVTDQLHTIISEEYDNSIKEPIKKYMRTKRVGSK